MRGAHLDDRMVRRIQQSPHRLTLHFPPARAVTTSTPVSSVPTSPLTRGTPKIGVLPAEPTPADPPVEVPCLWYPSYEGTVGSARRNQWDKNAIGWSGKADALARVIGADVGVVDPNNLGTSLFSTCEYVTFAGIRYQVLGVHPVTAGFKSGPTLHVALAGEVV
jgi:hypothetical protein